MPEPVTNSEDTPIMYIIIKTMPIAIPIAVIVPKALAVVTHALVRKLASINFSTNSRSPPYRLHHCFVFLASHSFASLALVAGYNTRFGSAANSLAWTSSKVQRMPSSVSRFSHPLFSSAIFFQHRISASWLMSIVVSSLISVGEAGVRNETPPARNASIMARNSCASIFETATRSLNCCGLRMACFFAVRSKQVFDCFPGPQGSGDHPHYLFSVVGQQRSKRAALAEQANVQLDFLLRFLRCLLP
jgi:hypothetical protein